ncbi:VRR-NUC domain-containing protein [Bifidobacterium myosotis]|uniref:VRR-NUC domain-containing protein n=1 Tax=Bifidobacterium myosotis TaxID=1630166 RepID=A0A5M9ZGG8_9BIFI|nr:VRR-NUC domain-containing protein [Bifidobacterium myosotis]KAA8825363.1 VRR-NUC domain-containing protein [Bifidobacterium myosotis]
MAVLREDAVERRFDRLALAHGGLALKWTSPGRIGVPDRLLFMPGGRLYMVELKRPGGRPRPSQLALHAKLERRGFHVWVVDDPDAFYAMIADASDGHGGDDDGHDDGRADG